MKQKKLPLKIGQIHFVGIGGIGMSGIAETLHNLGYQVQGSDLKKSANTERLEKLGIKVIIGHKSENINGASVVVISSAVKDENPEVVSAKEIRIPILKRAEMLAEIMRLKWSIAIAGTHGKTTTTSLIGTILEQAGLDPTIINGGIINAYGTNTRLGEGEWLVAEADESDGSFTKLPCAIAVVTNIDPEHMDHYSDFEDVKENYKRFIQQIPFYGFAVLCIDHPVVQSIIPDLETKKIISYGFSPQADIRGLNLRYQADGIFFDVKTQNGKEFKNIFLPMMGEHNVLNTLSAVAIALELEISENDIKLALAKFGGVKRRFTLVDTIHDIKIIDDYGHHPVEINAVLNAARKSLQDKKSKIIAVMQPHRYSRLQSLFKEFCQCFNQADMVFALDVYPAGEKPIDGINKDTLVKGIKESGHKNVFAVDNAAQLSSLISEIAKPNDMVIFLGAGDITTMAYDFPNQLKNFYQSKKPEIA